jgi:signal transduction histidine kinase
MSNGLFYTTIKLLIGLFFLNLTSVKAQNSDYSSDTLKIKKLLNAADDIVFKDFNQALEVTNKALQLSIHHNNKILIYKCYRKLGYINEQNTHLLDAKNAYQKALELLNFIPENAQMDILLDWAIINKQLGQYVVAQEYYIQALELAKTKGDFEIVSFSYHGLATLHSLLNNFEKAVEYNIQALKVSESLEDKSSEIKEYRNLSEIYRKSSHIDLAYKSLKKATQIAHELKDTAELSVCMTFEAKLLMLEHKVDAAHVKFKEILPYTYKVGDQRLICDILISLADIYTQKGMLEQANQCFQKTFLMKHKLTKIDLANYYIKYGLFIARKNKYEEAISAFQSSLFLAKEGHYKELIHQANIELYNIYREVGDGEKSLQYITTAYAYADSLLKDENNKRMVEAQFKYDIEENTKKFTRIQQQQERSKVNIILIASFILIVVLALFLWLQHKKNRILREKTAEIERKNYALEESNEVLLQYAYVSAHDLKEPLRSIGSFVNIIKRKYVHLLPPEATEYMNFVTDGVKRMETLLSALLEYSTIASEKIEDVKTASVSKALHDVLQNLSFKITEKDAKINYPSVLPDVKINHLHLTQIFQNLMSNSMKFCEVKPIIDFKILHKDDTFIISIKDNGIGMNKDYENKVFKLFQRLDRSKQYEGSGIGLTICKSIVEKYGGQIWFESAEGKGTNFFISFPKTLIVQPIEKNNVVKSESFA